MQAVFLRLPLAVISTAREPSLIIPSSPHEYIQLVLQPRQLSTVLCRSWGCEADEHLGLSNSWSTGCKNSRFNLPWINEGSFLIHV